MGVGDLCLPLNSANWHPFAEAYVYATGRVACGAVPRSRPRGVLKRIIFVPGAGATGLDAMRYPVERFCATNVIGGFMITLPRLRPRAGSYGSTL